MRWPIVVVFLLAGCLGNGGGDPGPSPGPGGGGGTGDPLPPDVPTHIPMLLAFGYTGCAGQMSHVDLPLATVQAALPAGYSAWQADGAGAEPTGRVEYLWVRCAAFATQAAQVNDTVYGHVALRIEPPANATQQDAHWYRLRMLTAQDVLETVWRAATYDVHAGAFRSSSETPPPLPPVQQTVSSGDYVLRATTITATDAVASAVAYYTEVPGGRLEWTGQVKVQRTQVAGELQVPSDDAFAGALSPVTVQGVHLVSGDFVGNDLWLRRA